MKLSRHSGPEWTAPSDQRCEALVKGQPSYCYAWMRLDRRCPRRANQMRGDMAVCYQHATAKKIVKFQQEKESSK